jgi:ring-1,2-phenylacetyl-CoA epoxidase subunit PaaD
MVENKIYSKQEIFEMLSQICDPEIPVVTIQEMGILRDVLIANQSYEVIITPTYSGCPAMHLIQSEILATLHSHNIHNVKVSTVYSPAWTTDWMSESTKNKLKNYGIAAPVQSSCMNWENPETTQVQCPRCNSIDTKIISQFGSTACKALYSCNTCKEPFDYFKCH